VTLILTKNSRLFVTCSCTKKHFDAPYFLKWRLPSELRRANFGAHFSWPLFNWNLRLSKVFASLTHGYQQTCENYCSQRIQYLARITSATGFGEALKASQTGSGAESPLPGSFSFNSIFIDTKGAFYKHWSE